MKIDPTTIPPRMLSLPRDRRGYPVPYIVMRDLKGDPHFTINDHEKSAKANQLGLCAICGGNLGTHKWFVGGPGSAFHKNGRYIDGPLHRECGTFALKTCPYLAMAGTYARRIDARTLKPDATPAALVLKDPTMHAPQPSVFVFADTSRYRILANGHLEPERPWKAVEFWRDGQQIGADEARAIFSADPTAVLPIDQLTLWQDR